MKCRNLNICLILMTFLSIVAGVARASDATVLRTFSLDAGQTMSVNIPASPGDLVGWRIVFAETGDAEQASTCPDSGCVTLRSDVKDSSFEVGGRFGAIAKTTTANPSYSVQNQSSFQTRIEILMLEGETS